MTAALARAATRGLSRSGLEERDLDEVFAQASRWVADLRGARLLLTGATGWFGTWLLDALVALDRAFDLDLRIVAVSRAPSRFAARWPLLAAAPAIEWIAADVRGPAFDVPRVLTHVIHAAGDTRAATTAPERRELLATLVDGTRRVLDIAVARGVRRLLFVSSGAVYGPQPPHVERIDETFDGAPDPRDPASTYGVGKRAAEDLCAVRHGQDGLATTIARCFAFVGPHMPFDGHFAIGNFIADAAAGRAVVVRGDGTPYRSYLYASDLVAWLLTILVDGEPLRPYNVGGDEVVSIEALARRCATGEAGVRIERRVAGGPSYVPSTRRARDELGLRATVSLDEALARTRRWRERTARVRRPA